jgi:hypothetical protein
MFNYTFIYKYYRESYDYGLPNKKFNLVKKNKILKDYLKKRDFFKLTAKKEKDFLHSLKATISFGKSDLLDISLMPFAEYNQSNIKEEKYISYGINGVLEKYFRNSYISFNTGFSHFNYQKIERIDNLFFLEVIFQYYFRNSLYLILSEYFKKNHSDFGYESYDSNIISIGLGWDFR